MLKMILSLILVLLSSQSDADLLLKCPHTVTVDFHGLKSVTFRPYKTDQFGRYQADASIEDVLNRGRKLGLKDEAIIPMFLKFIVGGRLHADLSGADKNCSYELTGSVEVAIYDRETLRELPDRRYIQEMTGHMWGMKGVRLSFSHFKINGEYSHHIEGFVGEEDLLVENVLDPYKHGEFYKTGSYIWQGNGATWHQASLGAVDLKFSY